MFHPPQAVHKIQSADGPLALNLSKVPKMLGVLRSAWAPGAFVVSFKLETDESILLTKVCLHALTKLTCAPRSMATLRKRVWASCAGLCRPGSPPRGHGKATTDGSTAPRNAPQASGAVSRYGVHAVVANLLHTRKDRVLVVHAPPPGAAPPPGGGAAAEGAGAAGGLVVADVRRPEGEPHIERLLVARVVELHQGFRRLHRDTKAAN